jgi:hypothetical protein
LLLSNSNKLFRIQFPGKIDEEMLEYAKLRIICVFDSSTATASRGVDQFFGKEIDEYYQNQQNSIFNLQSSKAKYLKENL